MRLSAADRAAGGQYATQRRHYRALASDLYLPDLLLQASTWNKLQSFVLLSPCCCTFLTDVLQQVLVSVLILRQLLGARMISMSTALCCQSGAFFENMPRWHLSSFKDPRFVSSTRTTLATSSLQTRTRLRLCCFRAMHCAQCQFRKCTTNLAFRQPSALVTVHLVDLDPAVRGSGRPNFVQKILYTYRIFCSTIFCF